MNLRILFQLLMKNVQIIKTMKILSKAIVLLAVLPLLFSCNSGKKESKVSETKIVADLVQVNTENKGLVLLQQKCYACHSITSKSHDEIIAPPMVAVKRRYKMSYASKQEFIKAITNWVMEPEKENVLMRGAVQQFNIMPKQPFNKEEISLIAKYMFENELERPIWFQKHFEDEHPNGMGRQGGNNSKSF